MGGVSPDAKQRYSQIQPVPMQSPDTARYACQDASAYPPLTPLSPSRVPPHGASTNGTRAAATASPVRTRQPQVQVKSPPAPQQAALQSTRGMPMTMPTTAAAADAATLLK